MLSSSDLLTQCAKPGIKNVSLAHYWQFYEDVLLKRVFRYVLQDGRIIDISFTPSGLYHLLGIQHIDPTINAETFGTEIQKGLDFPVFRQSRNRTIKKNFINMLDRIEMFSCTYQTMKTCRLFSVPSGIVKGTQKVEADYIIYREINGEGMSIGLRTVKNKLIPVTILADRKTHPQKHIDIQFEEFIFRLDIIDRASWHPIESIQFS